MREKAIGLIGILIYMSMAAPPKVFASVDSSSPAERPTTDVEPGRIAWFDIATSDIPKAKEFYGKLFGWTFNPVEGTDQAFEIVVGGKAIGSLRTADGKVSQFNGVVYVKVNDIQESSKKAKDLGGTIPEGFPFNLPGNKGSISVVADPLGHPIGMYSKSPMPTTPAR